MAVLSDSIQSENTLGPLGLLSNLPTLDETYGAVLLGSFGGLLLYGVLLHQAYRYARVYPHDRLVIKCFVLSVLILDSIICFVSIHTCYAYLVSNYFNPLALLRGIWSLEIQPLLAGFALLVCQSFFALRVYLLDKRHRALVVVSLLLTFVAVGFAIAGTVIAFRFHTFLEYERFYWIDSAACATAIVSDSLTAGVLIITLRRRRTGFKQTDTLLNTLILYTINTGLLTGIINTLALIFALIRPNNMVWIAIETVAVKLYTNSVLAVLNSRQALKNAADQTEPLELPTVPSSRSRPSRVCLDNMVESGDMTRKPNPSQWDSRSVVHICEEHGSI